MCKKLNLILKSPLVNTISIEKLGIVFRPLTEEEKKDILLTYDNFYFSSKAQTIIKNFLEYVHSKDYSIYKNKRKMNTINKYSDEQRMMVLSYEQLKNENIDFNRKTIKTKLNRVAVVEVSEKIEDYVDSDLAFVFISNIMRILLYINGDMLKTVKEYLICGNDFNLYSSEWNRKNYFILNYISDKSPKIYEEIDINEKELKEIATFIDVLSKNRIRDFIAAIDNILSKNSSPDNMVLNYVSCIERILVKYEKTEKYDIGKQIFLKYGLCINDDSEKDISEHIEMLKYCYEIRSCIIHGNDEDLMIAPQKILKINKKDIEKFIKSDKHSNNRFANVFFANAYLEANLDILIKAWIKNTSRIEFLKNN